MSQPSPPTLLSTFSTFLTVTIHSILFHRTLYDPSLFLSAKKYNIPVRQCRHPLLCAWIDDCVAHISELMKDSESGMETVSVVVLGPEPEVKPLERVVVDVSNLGMGIVNGGLDRELEEVERKEVEAALRAAVGKIVVGCEKLGDLPDGCTFTVTVDAREGKDKEVSKGARELEREGKAAVRMTRSNQKSGKGLQEVSFGEGLGSITIWIEESKRKRKYYEIETEEEDVDDPDVTA